MGSQVPSWITHWETDDSSMIYARLKERGIPFMIYSGFDTVGGACAGALHISKPAAPGQLVAAMESLILN